MDRLGGAEAVYFDCIMSELTAICEHYEKTAPTVHRWADELYQRVGEEPARVTLTELRAVRHFRAEDQWLQPNFAANHVFHVMSRLGQDTTGHAGF